MKRKTTNPKPAIEATLPNLESVTDGKTDAASNKKSSKRKKPKPDADDYTIEQVAALLNCSTKTVDRRIEAGLLAAVKDGGLRRIPVAEYLRYRARRNPAIKG